MTQVMLGDRRQTKQYMGTFRIEESKIKVWQKTLQSPMCDVNSP